MKASPAGFVLGSGPYHVPRFLLNDFARYWWTMAVDFAYKQRTRFGEGAAILYVLTITCLILAAIYLFLLFSSATTLTAMSL